MLLEYIQAAMGETEFKKLEDGSDNFLCMSSTVTRRELIRSRILMEVGT
ncbi:MAG: hypothetical protein IT393_00635 [Nitrospirae bacterium]|nr:hypothetical protein [Nitrospirota bacterium]